MSRLASWLNTCNNAALSFTTTQVSRLALLHGGKGPAFGLVAVLAIQSGWKFLCRHLACGTSTPGWHRGAPAGEPWQMGDLGGTQAIPQTRDVHFQSKNTNTGNSRYMIHGTGEARDPSPAVQGNPKGCRKGAPWLSGATHPQPTHWPAYRRKGLQSFSGPEWLEVRSHDTVDSPA